MNRRFDGRVAIVTGGAGGIGSAVSRAFAEQGAKVVVADINLPGAEEVSRQIVKAGGDALAVQVDVSDKAQADHMAQLATEKYGRIDIIVTCAAILEEAGMLDVTPDMWDRTIDTTLNGVMWSIKACLPTMKDQGYGKVVIMTSPAAFRGRELQTPFSSCAGTLVGIAANAGFRLGEFGINVNAVAPGIVDTEFPESLKEKPEYRDMRINNTPLRRQATPEDIVGPTLFLASDEAAFITGTTLLVDGGLSMYMSGYGL